MGILRFRRAQAVQVTYGELLSAVRAFRSADEQHPVYISLSTEGDPATFVETMAPDVLSLDRCQSWYGGQDCFFLLERYRQPALQYSMPLIGWVETNADENHNHYPPDNQQKLRQSVFTALAPRVTGVQGFGRGRPAGGGLRVGPARGLYPTPTRGEPEHTRLWALRLGGGSRPSPGPGP